MKYVNDGYDTHLKPDRQDATLCGETINLIHTNGQVPVTCPACLDLAQQAFAWALMHYADDVQSKATTTPVVRLGRITTEGRRIAA